MKSRSRPNFKRTILALLLLTTVVNHAQNNGFEEKLLYGCWTLTLEDNPSGEYLSFKHCETVPVNNTTIKPFTFEINPNGTCLFYKETTSPVCPPIVYYQIEGAWTFDQRFGVLTLFYPPDCQWAHTHSNSSLTDSNIALQFSIETLLPKVFISPLETVVLNTTL